VNWETGSNKSLRTWPIDPAICVALFVVFILLSPTNLGECGAMQNCETYNIGQLSTYEA
jgi:hypothetical protein